MRSAAEHFRKAGFARLRIEKQRGPREMIFRGEVKGKLVSLIFKPQA